MKAIACAVATAVLSGAQAAQVAQGAQGSSQQEQIPWPVQLGLRVAKREFNLRVVDQVVLVPDTATFVDELKKWTPTSQWPVLIEDGEFCPRFIRAFHPARVIRRTAAAPLPPDRLAQQQVLTDMVAASAPQGDAPLGVVFCTLDDPAWVAGLTLALGRGQPLLWLDGNFGVLSSDLPAAHFAEISSSIEKAVGDLGFPYPSLGDPIDAVTLCRELPAKTLLPAGTIAAPQGDGTIGSDDSFALTDALCRNSDGSRWAVAGWVFGDEVRAAYMAMSSLFAPRDSFWLVNSYGNDGPWGQYSMTTAAEMCKQRGWQPTLNEGEQVSVDCWLRMAMSGFAGDVLLVNSMGNWDFFQLWQQRKAYPEDVPVLDQPTALHMIHSWSLWQPNRVDYVGGRWLGHGVYAYIGSVREPGLQAFIPPEQLVARLASTSPFLIAARWCDGPMDRAWRVTTIGDPLMIIEPPDAGLRRRVVPPASVAGDEQDLRQLATAALRRTKGGSSAAWGDAMRALELLGDDAMSLNMWTAASQSNDPKARVECAPSVLGALFRARNKEEFLVAFRLIPAPGGLARDMLWGAWTPFLASTTDVSTLDYLATQVRQSRPQADLSRLLPAITRVNGPQAARAILQSALEATTDEGNRKELTYLLGTIR